MTGFLYDMTTTAVLSLAAVWSVCSLCAVGPTGPSVRLVTMLGAGFCVMVHSLKTRARIALLGILTVVGVEMYLTAEGRMRLEWFRENQWILWVLFCCLACFGLERIAKRQKLLKGIPALAGVFVFAVQLIRKMHPEKGLVFVILLYIVLTVVELLQLYWKKEGDTDAEAHVVYALPFIGLLFVILCLTKAPDEPYRWDLVKRFAEAARIRYEMIMQSFEGHRNWGDGECTIGFSTDAHIRGHLGKSAYKVLKINSVVPQGTKVYLAGKTFDTFDGRSWSKQDQSETDYRMYDILETYAAIVGYDPENISNYIQSGHLDIKYMGIRSAHVFAPAKTLSSLRGETAVQQGGDMMFAKQKMHTYSLNFYRLNRVYEGFETLLREGVVTEEQSFYRALDLIGGSKQSGYTPQGLAAYTEHVYACYGQTPELTEEMNAYLEEVLSGADSDYDKLLRIEGLLANMRYTTKPGELPEDVDSPETYLAYFLSEAQEGYCTHFATAFVLLARAAGIPARYVQGFCYTADRGEMTVLSDCAHAWPEAYIKGVGWITFEPTPGMQTASGWAASEDTQEKGQLSAEDNARSFQAADEEEEQLEESESLEPIQDMTQGGHTRGWIGKLLQKIRVAAFPAAVFLVLFVLADAVVRRYRYRHMTERERISYLWKKNLVLLKRVGQCPKEGETLAEFAARAGGILPGETLSFIQVYEEILYGEKEADVADTALFETAGKALWKVFWASRLLRIRQESTK